VACLVVADVSGETGDIVEVKSVGGPDTKAGVGYVGDDSGDGRVVRPTHRTTTVFHTFGTSKWATRVRKLPGVVALVNTNPVSLFA
jgi:hypothetical protein